MINKAIGINQPPHTHTKKKKKRENKNEQIHYFLIFTYFY